MIEGLQEILKADSTRSTKVDCNFAVEEYINKSDWRISANSNTSYSSAGLVNNLAGKVIANYWLDKVYSKKEGDAHRNGDYHIHDLDCLQAYCCGHDLQTLLNEGFNGVVGRVGAKPPKHFREALYQMANFIGILQAEWAGAQAFSSFDTFLAPYLFFDMVYGGMTKDDAKKAIRNFVYNLNVPSRWGQSPFSNVTIDWYVPKSLKELGPTRNSQPYFVDAFGEIYGENWTEYLHSDEKLINFVDELRHRLNMGNDMDDEDVLYSVTYSLFQKEMDIINECYYSVMNEGDKDGNPFTFPIPTVNIDEDFDWNHPNVNILFENTARYGTSYFQNFIGSQYKKNENGELVRDENAYSPADIRSMCPLSLDTLVMTKHGNIRICDLDPQKDLVFTGKYWTRFEKSPIYHNHRIFEITFEDGSNIHMSALHEQPVHGVGNVFAQDLNIGDSCDFYRDGKIEQLKIVRIERGIIGETICLETENDEHTFVLANGLITSNCRLQLDKTLLRKRGGGLFGSDAQTGSIGVVTINLARLGYLFKGDLKGLYKRLDHLMDLAKSTLEKKRVFVKEMNARGLYPYTRRYLKTYDTYFSTIGVNGGNEMIRNFTNDEYDITDPRGQKMAMDLLTHIRERLLKYQDETGNLYNLEATPGEGTCYRFAREDQKQFGDAIIQAGVPEAPYYTNSTQLPVYYTNDVFTALDLQDDLQKSYTGGTVLHIYTDEEISAEECKTLIKKVISNYRLPYVSFTATFSTCPKHGRIPGVHEYCPLCDKELMEQHIKEIDLNKD